MSSPDQNDTPSHLRHPEKGSTTANGPEPFAHLVLRDKRTPEERREAEAREWRRRHGSGRRKWWEQPHSGDGKDEPPRE